MHVRDGWIPSNVHGKPCSNVFELFVRFMHGILPCAPRRKKDYLNLWRGECLDNFARLNEGMLDVLFSVHNRGCSFDVGSLCGQKRNCNSFIRIWGFRRRTRCSLDPHVIILDIVVIRVLRVFRPIQTKYVCTMKLWFLKSKYLNVHCKNRLEKEFCFIISIKRKKICTTMIIVVFKTSKQIKI